MEWLLLAVVVLVAALLIAPPLWAADGPPDDGGAELVAERARLLAELREFDDDAAAGRISAQDRREGRQALAPRLRVVTEQLREDGRG
ncbi:MAG TPA: hypothetical protein QGI71_08930 [Dehalococcoidia bacterium]|jgi:hypothetical protein|nr:hypothetical protein [Dehalococcoidia bacterium]